MLLHLRHIFECWHLDQSDLGIWKYCDVMDFSSYFLISVCFLKETAWEDMDWIYLTWDKGKWWTLMYNIMKIWIPHKVRNFSTQKNLLQVDCQEWLCWMELVSIRNDQCTCIMRSKYCQWSNASPFSVQTVLWILLLNHPAKSTYYVP